MKLLLQKQFHLAGILRPVWVPIVDTSRTVRGAANVVFDQNKSSREIDVHRAMQVELAQYRGGKPKSPNGGRREHGQQR
jgi:hypothetical protein